MAEKKSAEASAWEVSYRTARNQMEGHNAKMRRAAKAGDEPKMIEHRDQVLRLSDHLKMMLRKVPKGARP